MDEAVDVPGYGHILKDNISIAPIGKGQDYTDIDTARCTLERNYTADNIPAPKGKPLFDYSTFVPEDYIQVGVRKWGNSKCDVVKMP